MNYDTDCYWFSDNSRSYEEAKSDCRSKSQNSELVEIKDMEEQSFLAGQYTQTLGILTLVGNYTCIEIIFLN